MHKRFMPNIFERETKPKEALKSEHLEEGAKPIMACIGTPGQFMDSDQYRLIRNGKINQKAHNVDYYGKPRDLKRSGFTAPRKYSYVMSPLDDKDKYSYTYRNCTGIVIAGIDRETGKELSFMTHQDPDYFLKNTFFRRRKGRFTRDLIQRLGEIKAKCKEGTVDAVIYGGNFLEEREYKNDYLRSVRLLSQKIFEVFGFKPAIITGPKIVTGEDDIFYNNTERKLHIMRPEVGDGTSESFSPRSLNFQRSNWSKNNSAL